MLNLAGTARSVLKAAGSITAGVIVPLGLPIGDPVRAEPVWPGRLPSQRYMVKDQSHYQAGVAATPKEGASFASDLITMSLHATTHMDALGHAWYDGTLYNGVSAERTVGSLRHANIARIAERGLVVPAVLVDMVSQRGRPLEAAETISCADIDAALESQGSVLPQGGALILRTGWLEDGYYNQASSATGGHYEEPGLDDASEAALYFAANDLVLLGTDTMGNEHTRSPEADEFQALHARLIRDLGVLFLEALDLGTLSATCSDLGRYEFCLVASPLRIEGATGCPVNPLALF